MDDPFQVFGLPRGFALDPQELHRLYIRASSKAHPDLTSDPVEQTEAAEQAAVINEAYGILRDPASRADVLLALFGGPRGDGDKSLPPALLMEVMEAREQMERAEQQGDREGVAASVAWARGQLDEGLERVEALFKKLESGQGGDRDSLFNAVRMELNAIRYFQRMVDQAPAG